MKERQYKGYRNAHPVTFHTNVAKAKICPPLLPFMATERRPHTYHLIFH
jgi:hypothetical protein